MFRFRLATLLRLREADRDEKRLLLADAQQALRIVGQRIAGIDGELADMQAQAMRASRPGPVDVGSLIEVQRYEVLLTAERQAAIAQKQSLEVEAAERREVLVAADREVRVLEKLRDVQHERHRQDAARQAVKQLDETGSQAHLRRARPA